MGVYSEIAIKIYSDSKDSLDKFGQLYDILYKKQNQETRDNINLILSEMELCLDRPLFDFDSEETFVFYAQEIKWYSGVPSVDFFIELFDLAKTIPGLSGEYLQIQDDSEIFQETFGDECRNLLYPVCSIGGL